MGAVELGSPAQHILSRIEGATYDAQFKAKNGFIAENIDFIAEKLLKLLKDEKNG